MENDAIRQKLNELKEKMPIDPFNLEEECVNQPLLYAEIGELATEARSEAKRAKEELDQAKADLSFRIRKSPDEFDLSKITEAGVESTILLQNDYREAADKYLEKQRMADSFGVLQAAAEQRKSMIKDLVTLYVYNYYSSNQEQKMDPETKSMGSVTREQIINRRRELSEQRNNDTVEEEEE